MNRNRLKIKIILTSTLLLSSLLIILIVIHNTFDKRYVWNYSTIIGVGPGDTLEDVHRRFGEPLEIIPPSYPYMFYTISYDNICVIIGMRSNPHQMTVVQGIRITGKDFQFGKYQIGIGSSKYDVIDAYGVDRVYTFQNRKGNKGLFVIDGRAWLSFFFNDLHYIYEISITFDGP